MKQLGLVMVATMLLPPAAWGGTVIFKNGDSLQGELVRVEKKAMTFRSEVAGRITLPLEKIDSFDSEQSVAVMLRLGGVKKGRARIRPDGSWEVGEEENKKTMAPEEVVSVLSEALYQETHPQRRVRLWQNWKGGLSLGYGLVQGTTDASTVTAAVSGTRKVPDIAGIPERVRTGYNLNMILASTAQQDGLRITTETASTGLRQDYLFSGRGFLFWTVGFDHNEALNLKLRQNYGGGFGYDWIKNSRAELSLLAGTVLTRENFHQRLNRTQAEALLGEKFRLKLVKNLEWVNEIRFFPSLSNRGQFRLNGVSSLVSRITKTLSFQIGLTDNYISNPLGGRQKNQFSFTSGLGFHF